MTMQAEATEFRLPTPGRRPARVTEDPVMRVYCTTLARFAGSIQSTELTLSDYAASDRETTERAETAHAIRSRSIEKATAEAAAADEDVTQIRAAYGLGGDVTPVSGSVGFGASSDDLAPATATLARSREELRQAGDEVERWVARRDETTHKLGRIVATTATIVVAAIMIVILGDDLANPWSVTGLILLTIGAVAAAGAGLATRLVRRSPDTCTGPPLARTPDPAAALRQGAIMASYAAIALLVIRVGAALLS